MKLSRLSIVATGLLSLSTAVIDASVDLPPRGNESVHDLAGQITRDDREIMERSHRDLRTRTGVVLSVVTLRSLEGEELQEVLQRAGPEWGLGRGTTDTGIVVALSMQEHSVLIATGHGVEEFLPDARVQKIIHEVILPRLYRNDVSHAMLHASSALIAIASQKYGTSVDAPIASTDSRRLPGRSWPASLVVILFFMALGARPLVLRLVARRAAVLPVAAPRRGGGPVSRKGAGRTQ